jgi:hypothetical protein
MKHVLLAAAVVALAIGFASTRPATGHAAAATVSVPKCPSHAPKFTSLNGTSKHFVRPGARRVRLCRFYKVNWADSLGLWRQRLIGDGTTISSLTHAFNKLKEPPRGIFCMKDNGSEMVLFFGYAGAKPERVVVKLSGCRFASNGQATRSTTAGLHKRLLALAHS